MTSGDIEIALGRAIQSQQRGLHDEAAAVLDQALRRFPDSPHLHNARGMSALAVENATTALRHFERAAALDRSEPTLQMNVANAARMLGNEARERTALDAALSLDQRHFMARLRLAELLERQGLLSEAAPHWSAVTQLADASANAPPLVVDAAQRGRAFLNRHNHAFAQALHDELGDLMQGGKDRRMRACIDAMLGRRTIYRNECAGIHFPFLPADEFFDRDLFAWFGEVEKRTNAFRAEALAMLAQPSDNLRPYVRQLPGTPTNKWSALDNRLDWTACFLWEYGERCEEVCARCPETAAMLDDLPAHRVPGKAPNAFFSILRPGARIPPHTGVTNTRAIVHLPLVVPPNCGFRVGGEIRAWEEGKAFAFDDTIEHEAWNDSNEARVVLIFDVWNPHLTADERSQMEKLFMVAERGVASTKAG